MAVKSSEDSGGSVPGPVCLAQICTIARTYICSGTYTHMHPKIHTRNSQPLDWTQDKHALTHAHTTWYGVHTLCSLRCTDTHMQHTLLHKKTTMHPLTYVHNTHTCSVLMYLPWEPMGCGEKEPKC